jgi:hypothetical protein
VTKALSFAGGVGLGAIGGEMAGPHHVVHDLGDVGAMVAAALDILGDEQQVRAQPDGTRVFHHVGEQLAEQAVVDLVDLAVAIPHRLGFLGIAAGESVQHLLELVLRRLAHARQALGETDRRLAIQHQSALGDVLGEIADAFQFARGLDRGQGLAQVHRHGLAQGEQFERPVFDFLLHLVDAAVAAHRAFRRRTVAAGNGFDGGSELSLGKTPHLRHQRGQRFQLFPEGLDGVLGHFAFSNQGQPGHLRAPLKRFTPLLCDCFITFP